MKVIKRNGSEVDFDSNKIKVAITKANNATLTNKLTDNNIEYITKFVTKDCKALNRPVNIEEIQDLVEKYISSISFDVAKNYITYRYQRALSRKNSTLDDKILAIVDLKDEEAKGENSNKNPVRNSTQRDYVAGEISRDLTNRVLLPKEIVDAHKEGIIHFHDSDYFIHHEHNCDLLNLEDMLQNGTVITDTHIDPPKSFSTACNIATQIIAQVASNQYGGQTITLSHLAPFVDVYRQKVKKKLEKEYEGVQLTEEQKSRIVEMRVHDDIERGVQTIQYQVLTLLTSNGTSLLKLAV